MIIKFNNKVLTIGNKWCNGDNIPPLYEDPTILYPKNTSVVNSLTLNNLPTITQRYGVVSFDAKIDLPPENVEVTSVMALSRMDIKLWMNIADSGYSTITHRWDPKVTFASVSQDAGYYASRFITFSPTSGLGTSMIQIGLGHNLVFDSYKNDTYFVNSYIDDYHSADRYTRFKLVFDRNTNTVYQYLNNTLIGTGTLEGTGDVFLSWYNNGADPSNPPSIQGGPVGTIKNVEIVSFNDFDSAAAYT